MFSSDHHHLQLNGENSSNHDRTAAAAEVSLQERRALLEIAGIELELKERNVALKTKELEYRKRARDLEYESIDKALDRYNAYCTGGGENSGNNNNNLDGLDEKLKAKYRRMIEEA